jgi:hypothetical protein
VKKCNFTCRHDINAPDHGSTLTSCSYSQFQTLMNKNTYKLHSWSYIKKGRAITQAVSRRLPAAAARVRAQVRSCGICGGQSGTSVFAANSHSTDCSTFIIHHLSSGAGAIGQLVADVPSGLRLTPPQETKKNT